MGNQSLAFYSQFYSDSDFLSKTASWKQKQFFASHADERQAFVRDNSRFSASTHGFKVRRYRSGETTGAFFTTGTETKVIPPARTGILETSGFTVPGRQKIRRSVENSDTFLRYFCTLTFAPQKLRPWELNLDGTVRHDFAKWKLKKFLDACYRKQKRLKRELNYVWVAEIQTENTGNIHFHILWDKFFDIKYLSKIWAQENNSVDIAPPLKNPAHAANYMRKYITKDEFSVIQGNRYFISQGLRASMHPKERTLIAMSKKDIQEDSSKMRQMRERLYQMREAVEAGGGTVLDFGFSIPAPRTSKKYIDKVTKEEKLSKAVDPTIARDVLRFLTPPVISTPF